MKLKEEIMGLLSRELRRSLVEHRHIIKLLQDLEDLCEESVAGSPVSEEFARRLRKLEVELRHHFSGEERPGGYYTSLGVEFPALTERLERLAGEHQEILEDVRAAALQAEAVKGQSDGKAKQIACRVRLAIARLRRHESEENELLQRVYCDQMGAGD
jgi:hypothetical protein